MGQKINKVILLSRPKDQGVSIQKVFGILQPHLERYNPIQHVYMKYSIGTVKNILSNIITTLKIRSDKSVKHITGAVHYLSYFLKPYQTITTVHDLGMVTNENNSKLRRELLSFLLIRSLKRNRYIVCISEKTKGEVLSYIKYPEDRIIVIPDPLPDEYIYTPHSFNDACPRILHIGTKPNKNLGRTIQALNGLKIHLHIIGKLDDDTRELLRRNNIIYTNNYDISEQELLEEYKKCDIVNFPSLYEGFGMPIIEAQAIGRICITSNIEPMVNVAGDGGAVLVDPNDVQSIRLGYLNAINDEEYRNRVIENGRRNSSKYQAAKIALQYKEIYDKIAL